MPRPAKKGGKAWAAARSELMKLKLEAIVTEADLLFARKGYAATSLEDVAGRLNITKTALYHYVKNKNELLYLCYKRALERTEEYYDQADAKGGTGLEKLVTYLKLDAEGGVISMTPLTEIEALKDPKLRKELTDRIHAIEARFQGFIEEGMEDGSIADCDPKLTSLFILGASRSMLQWYNDEGHDLVKIVEEFVHFCMNGIARR